MPTESIARFGIKAKSKIGKPRLEKQSQLLPMHRMIAS